MRRGRRRECLELTLQHHSGSFASGPGRPSSPNTRMVRCLRPCLTQSSWNICGCARASRSPSRRPPCEARRLCLGTPSVCS